jgi:hypothetical protein
MALKQQELCQRQLACLLLCCGYQHSVTTYLLRLVLLLTVHHRP